MRRLGPFAPLAAFVLAALAALTASRMLLVALWAPRLADASTGRLLAVGLHCDAMALGWLVFPAAVVVGLAPRPLARPVAAAAGAWLAGVAGLVTFLEAAAYPFVAQYDARPNRVFLDYLVYPHEVLGTVWADHKVAVILGLGAVALVVRGVWRRRRGLLVAQHGWSWRSQLVVTPLALALVFLAARGGLGHRGGNISTAAFSRNHLANELASSSAYDVGYALWSRVADEADTTHLYGRLDRGEAIARVRAGMGLPAAAFPRDDVPLLHHQASTTPRRRPANLVVFLQESLGAEYVGTLGGLPLTPNLDMLAADGMLLTNLFATGTRTVRGIEATVCGFLPTPATSVVKRGLAQSDFFTAAALLRRHGYTSEFLYGGQSEFDNMRGFFLNNGFDTVVDESSFGPATFRGTWGVSDEDLVRRANERFVAHGDRPFFALMLSTSNHPPFEFPSGRITLFEQPPNTVHNAIKYADSAIGELFRLARREAYYANTIFVIVADHDTRVYGRDLVPIDRFHIPGLIIGPGVAPRRYDGLASQVDLLPTVLDLMGLDVDTPLVGHDLVAMPPDEPGHAFMQYDLVNGYRTGDDLVVLAPYKTPREFRVEGTRLAPVALDPERARDALAHVQVPALLYDERRYRLPAGPRG